MLLFEFQHCTIYPGPKEIQKMDTTIDDVLLDQHKEGYLVAVSNGSVEHMHQVSFGWVLTSAKG